MAMQRFYWLVKGEIAGSSLPRSAAEVNTWREANIRAVVSLVETRLKFDGFTALHLPVPDMTAPSIAQLDAACAFIDRARLARAPVVVHCLGGKGRTGTVLAAWLISKGMGVADAMTLVRALSPGSIETPETGVGPHRVRPRDVLVNHRLSSECVRANGTPRDEPKALTMQAFLLDPANTAQITAAPGAILAEEVTIGRRRAFHKGHPVSPGDLELLATAPRPIHAVRLTSTDVHEDEAARRLGAALAGPGLTVTEPRQSRVNLVAKTRGLLRVDVEAVTDLNLIQDISIFHAL